MRAAALVATSLLLAAAFRSAPSAFQTTASRTFKVATWNIRSGMGIRGFASTGWDSNSSNCTDRSRPMNAWGMGLPQRELERIKADPSIVALALQEAWHCGSPANVNQVLGFKTPTREQEGVTLLARFGFRDGPSFQQIDATHHRWVVGGPVCLDPSCSTTVPIFATHFGGSSDDDFPAQAEKLVETLARQTVPHVFMGDLNVFRIDRWNPEAPCTARDSAGRVGAIATIERAGYVDTWKALQQGEGWTGMASRKGCGSPPGSFYKRIDYVFQKGLHPLSIQRFAQAAPGADSPSDHAGLIAEFAWPARSSR
jgi:endonuclease/exonuclease/phosphatase family metal-dependent hydrolase